MSDIPEIHRQAFREEAYELLAELEGCLLEWEQQPADRELVGRLFRAFHTIKGSGSMFGFDDVAAFTHHVETALDLVRSGALGVDKPLIDLTLAARDQIKAMIEAESGGEPADAAQTADLEAAFRKLASSATKPAAPAPAPDQETPVEASGETTYRIRFRPDKGIFGRGTNPVPLLDELRALGDAHVVAQLDRIPPLDQIAPADCYTYWDVILTTRRGINAIKDVFIFVEDESELAITVIDKDGRFDPEAGASRLGDILVERGDLTVTDLERVMGQRARIGERLVDAGVVSEDRVQSALLEQQHVKELRDRRERQVSVASIRVASDRLDKLVDLVGEMVTVQARLSQTARTHRDGALPSIAEEVEHLTAELRDHTMSIRMVPIATLFTKFSRVVRDLSTSLGREVEMVTSGGETELDKTIIERLSDPLVHIIRNSMDHGIEPAAEREAAGKPRKGRLRIAAEHSGAYVLIHIEDDGQGIDRASVRAKAVERGLIQPNTELSEQAVFDLICSPGFSTSGQVTGVSGRGVGMDVVKRNIEALRGAVEITSEAGKGTRITLKIPLTLAIIDGLLVAIGQEFFVVPLALIEECVELPAAQAARLHGRSTVTVREELVPFIRLRDRFSINGGSPEIEHVVISSVNNQRLGLVVDRVVGTHQIVIKALGRVFRHIPDVSGATVLGDGSVALILDVARMMHAAEAQHDLGTRKRAPAERAESGAPP